MNLHNADLGCVLVRVLIERQQPWLVRFDELHQTGNALPFRIQLSRLQSVACDEDERSSHQSFLTSSELLAGVRRRSRHRRVRFRVPPVAPPPRAFHHDLTTTLAFQITTQPQPHPASAPLPPTTSPTPSAPL